jgi:hypothetical protein
MQGIGDMGTKRGFPFGIGILLCVIFVLAGVMAVAAAVKQAALTDKGRADMIVIDNLKAFGPLERPVVRFFHDKHTDALAKQNAKPKKDCAACHETVKGKLSQKFKRVQDNDKKTVMDIYHNQCIGCHEESAAPDKPGGPVTCGECHIKDASLRTTWQPIALDKSLHYRHVKANEKKCESCHHEYNAQTKALYYAKGKEGACLYCHKQETEENRISNRLASHQSCIACHQKLTVANKDAGPIQCGGCHDPKQQALVEKVTNVPRMERKQPDVVLVKTMVKQGNPQSLTNRMLPVPFDHKAHEGYNDSCRQCHHAGLQSCATCHTIPGADEGRQIKLAQAMHQNNADSSCIGCHNQEQAKPECAGCHSSIPRGQSLTSEASCKVCHMETPAAMPFPAEGSEESKTAAMDLLASRKPAPEMVPLDQIPEKVIIKALSNEYEPAVMPHRKIVLKLAEGMKDNRLAGHFHTDPTTLCQGCHHKSPGAVKPPQCANCHGRSSEALNLTRPGLMAAYHQQCIQCHDEMGLEKPASRDCTACHAKRK